MAEKTVILRLEVQGFGAAKQDLEFLTTETDKLAAAKKRLSSESKLTARTLTAEEGSVEQLRAKTALLKQEYNNIGKSTENYTQKRKQLGQQISANMQQIREHDRILSGSKTLVGEYERGISSSFKKIGASIMTAAGAYLSIQGATRILNDIVKTSVEFEAAMSDVKAVSGATAKEFSDLTEQAITLGSSTKFSAKEVSGLQKEYAKLGFSAGEILAVTKATIELAAATGEELAPSATIAGSTLRQFRLDATQMQRVVDVMAESFNKSALDLNTFATSMQYVGPVANAVGQTLEQATGKLAVLANSGLDASIAGTSLRNIYIELEKRGMSWDEAMNRIENSQNKASISLELFGKRGAVAGIILADNQKQAEEFTKDFENAGGAAKKMSDIMMDNVAGSAKILGGAWDSLILRTNESNGALKGFLDTLVDVVSAINTKGKPAIDSMFETRQIDSFADKWKFYASQGIGFFETLNNSVFRSKKTTQEFSDALSKSYAEEKKKQDEATEATLKAEAAKKEATDKALEKTTLSIEQEEKARKAAEKRAKEEKAWTEQRLKDIDAYNEAATKGYTKTLSTNLSYSRAHSKELIKIDKQTEATQEDIQEKLTKKTKEELRRRKDLEQQLKEAVVEGAQLAADAIFSNKKDNLQSEMEAELSNENLTEAQKVEIRKKYAKEQQKVDIKQAIINGILSIAKTFATLGWPAGIIPAALAAAQTAIQVAAIKAQKFATGGKILGSGNVTPDRNGDNTLILAKPGEVVLNHHQQSLLGGANTFKKIGVPGFATGGLIGSVNQSPGNFMDTDSMIEKMIKGFNDKKVLFVMSDLQKNQKKYNLITKASPL